MSILSLTKTAIESLLNQESWTSHPEGGGCYRAEDGTKCPIGMLISDTYYTLNLEGHSIMGGMVRSALEASFLDLKLVLTEKDFQMLRTVQASYDLALNYEDTESLSQLKERFVKYLGDNPRTLPLQQSLLN